MNSVDYKYLLKMGKRTYEIGNVLRGWFTFQAKHDEDAWKKGCAIFNESFPSKRGRIVFLRVKVLIFGCGQFVDVRKGISIVERNGKQ